MTIAAEIPVRRVIPGGIVRCGLSRVWKRSTIRPFLTGPDLELAPDVTLFPGTILQGRTSVGEGSEIGPDTRLVDCRIGSGSRIEKTMAEGAIVGADCHVGPFAVLAPGTDIATATRTGPFYTSERGGS